MATTSDAEDAELLGRGPRRPGSTVCGGLEPGRDDRPPEAAESVRGSPERGVEGREHGGDRDHPRDLEHEPGEQQDASPTPCSRRRIRASTSGTVRPYNRGFRGPAGGEQRLQSHSAWVDRLERRGAEAAHEGIDQDT